MNALYVIGNINLETVTAVAENIKNVTEQKNKFDKLFIISTDNSHQMIHDQEEIYFSVLGEMRSEEVVLDINDTTEQRKLVEIFRESDDRFIDLTNGPKPIAAVLYMVANLCEIDDLYYLMRTGDGSSQYVKMSRFVDTEAFTEFAFFDLIYYNEEIESIFRDMQSRENSFIRKCHSELRKAVSLFFIQKDYKNVIISATCGVEGVIAGLLRYLQSEPDIVRYASENGVQLNGSFDPVGIETRFFKRFLDNSGNSDRALRNRISYLNSLQEVPWILSMLREFRNAAAHYTMHSVSFGASEARLVMNAAIELFRAVKNNNGLWSNLHEDV